MRSEGGDLGILVEAEIHPAKVGTRHRRVKSWRRRPHDSLQCPHGRSEARKPSPQTPYSPRGQPPTTPPAVPREPSARALRYREHRIPRRHRVFVNRNLRMTKIRAIGFDLDHTLAHYDPGRRSRTLAFDLTKREAGRNQGISARDSGVPSTTHRGSSGASWSTRSAATSSRWITSTSSRAPTTD